SLLFCFVFFFSSRRRHTRFSRDWSSDVCSSDLASNSMASTLFLFLIFRKYYKYAFLLFLFPLIFAYSRVYLGLHFPSDILVGYIFGSLIGSFFYIVYKKYNSETVAQKKSTLLITFISVMVYFLMCNVLVSVLKIQ